MKKKLNEEIECRKRLKEKGKKVKDLKRKRKRRKKLEKLYGDKASGVAFFSALARSISPPSPITLTITFVVIKQICKIKINSIVFSK